MDPPVRGAEKCGQDVDAMVIFDGFSGGRRVATRYDKLAANYLAFV